MGNEFKKLKKNKDYVKVIDDNLDGIPSLLGVYIPLNYKAAHILTKKAGNTKAQWCSRANKKSEEDGNVNKTDF